MKRKQPGEQIALEIKRLDSDADAAACATMLAGSEPWITLRSDTKTLLAALEDPTREVYLALAGRALAGLVMVNMQEPFAGYIQVLAVAPEWRSHGVGSQLVAFAEERIFRDSPNVFLCVSGFNTRAQQFYARLGYKRIGRLKDYVIRGASEYLMRKTIGPKRDFKPKR